jgi:hypothetical protein
MDFGFGGGVGDRQPLQNIIITILYHEHFSHGTSTFNENNVKGLSSPCLLQNLLHVFVVESPTKIEENSIFMSFGTKIHHGLI